MQEGVGVTGVEKLFELLEVDKTGTLFLLLVAMVVICGSLLQLKIYQRQW